MTNTTEIKKPRKKFRLTNDDLLKLFELVDDKQQQIMELPLGIRKYFGSNPMIPLKEKLKDELDARGVWEDD